MLMTARLKQVRQEIADDVRSAIASDLQRTADAVEVANPSIAELLRVFAGYTHTVRVAWETPLGPTERATSIVNALNKKTRP